MKVYIAAPFFNDEQLERVERVKRLLSTLNVKFFSPKDESIFKQGDDPSIILNTNCDAICASDFIIAITDDKDVGTMWECGYAYGLKVPILYLWLGWTPDKKFNIMLAASGSVVHTYEELAVAVQNFKMFNNFNVTTNGEMLHE